MVPMISRTVLIVEDDALFALELQQLALKAGWRVDGPFHNLENAVIHAREDDVDFALLDFDLGHGTDVLPVAEELSSRRVRYAVITAARLADVRAAMPRSLVLAKPVHEGVIADLLNSEAASRPRQYFKPKP